MPTSTLVVPVKDQKYYYLPMPLPGGPSEKAGNQYERYWTVRCLLDLITGRATTIRIEPPGEDGIEFRIARDGAAEVHQVKRGNRTEGRWTVSELTKVLETFHEYIRKDGETECFFVSGDGVKDLTELSDRARQAETLDEFTVNFLASNASLRDLADKLQAGWSLDTSGLWRALKRIHIETISSSRLQGEIKLSLGALFEGNPSVALAVLSQLVSDSTHKSLTGRDIEDALLDSGIRRRRPKIESLPLDILSPPPSVTLYGRNEELRELDDAMAASVTTFIGGLPGMGKTALASNAAARWGTNRTLWVDCDAISEIDVVVSAVAEYSDSRLGAKELKALSLQTKSPKLLGRVMGKILGQHRILVVWEDLDRDRHKELAALIQALDSTIDPGRQLITEQQHRGDWSLPLSKLIEAPPLSLPATVEMLCALEITDLATCEAIWRNTGGHPYLLRMIASVQMVAHVHEIAASGVLHSVSSWVENQIISSLSETQAKLLTSLSVFSGTFPGDVPFKWAEDAGDVIRLQNGFLLLPAPGGRYRVHRILRDVLLSSLRPESRKDIHGKAYRTLEMRKDLSWLDLREMLRQANQAGLAGHVEDLFARFIQFAAHHGNWNEVLEMAEVFTGAPESKSWFLPHFLKGRALRMAGRLDEALQSYEDAERMATDVKQKHIALGEKAAAKHMLGDVPAARACYQLLCEEDSGTAAAGAHTALCRIEGVNGDLEKAVHHYESALGIAQANPEFIRERAGAQQTMGEVLLIHEEPERALVHLRDALRIRQGLSSLYGANDLLGKYHLLSMLIKAERLSGDESVVIVHARELLELAKSANDPGKISETLWLLTEFVDRGDAEAALSRRTFMSALRRLPPADYPAPEVYALLSKSFWFVGEYEESLEVLFEGVRAAAHRNVPSPTIFHVPQAGCKLPPASKVHDLGGGASLLVIPDSLAEQGLHVLADSIMTRRPDLAPFVVGIKGEMPHTGRRMRPSGRNDVCECGSGKTQKKCCGRT